MLNKLMNNDDPMYQGYGILFEFKETLQRVKIALYDET